MAAGDYSDTSSLSSNDDGTEEYVLAVAEHSATHNTESSAVLEDGVLGNEAPTPLDESTSGKSAIMASRAYQLEMFAESMKQNIIVAMDTGSGKTQVAVLRIKAELERTGPEKVIWFLAPTVSLCNQQFEVLRTQIPAVQTKFLSGDDDFNSWSEQAVWDAVLKNVRLVVSTYQMLLDALSHAFMRMEKLSLIVFDEAHNCVGNSPGSMIMTAYQKQKRARRPVPHILGLTASPIIGSKLKGIENLETALDSVCKSPTIHRDELLTCVKRPQMSYVPYASSETQSGSPRMTPCMARLRLALRNLDILQDPYVLHLKTIGTDRSRRELEDTLSTYDTYIQKQMVSFCRASDQIFRDLGPWAADYYIWEVITKFRTAIESRDVWLDNWKDDEKRYLANALSQVEPQRPPDSKLSFDTLTEKVAVLVKELMSNDQDVVGIIFVKERVTVAILSYILRLHPLIRKKYQVGAIVGTSQFMAKKREIWDLSRAEDLKSLNQFRSGKINLLIATSVLEEGIDVPACNLVVCFDKTDNLKSFIQRRGRARMRESRLVVLLEQSAQLPTQWEALETEMKRLYEDQERVMHTLQEIEDSELPSTGSFVVPSTGAILNFDNAKQHLDHFCRFLSPGEYIDWRPDYIPLETGESEPGTHHARVLLPSYIPAHVRFADSKTPWKSQKNSTKDAAFQAYLNLYNAGLVNENLLPFKTQDFISGAESRAPVVQVNGLLNPWLRVAQAWQNHNNLWSSSVRLRDPEGSLKGEFCMVLPIKLPSLQPLPVYFDHNAIWFLEFDDQVPILLNQGDAAQHTDHSAVLLALPFSHRWPADLRQSIVRFIAKDANLSMNQLGAVSFGPEHAEADELPYLIRDQSGCPYLYDGVISSKPPLEAIQRPFYGFDDAPEDVQYLILRKWSRRADFLHRPQSDLTKEQASLKTYARVYPATWAKMDTINFSYAQFGVFIPSILHQLEISLIAQGLSTSLLGKLAISDHSLVLTAISARSAAEATNYERLEFLGDSILKVCATVNASAIHPDWPEGYLSGLKDSLVSNSRLCRAAVEHGLDKFILSKPFTGHKWRPIYVDDVLQLNSDTSAPRKLATKTLADVVEALIGASMVDGGLSKALLCISIFLKEIEWMDLAKGRSILFGIAPPDVELPAAYAPLEQLIGYRFRKKSLLIEAMTHASYNVGTGSACLERLEFVGDAVLDNIIVTTLFAIEPPLPHQQMHLLKTAMVNGDFLGFLTLERSVEQEQVDINRPNVASDPTKLELVKSPFTLPLWKFMRHCSPAIAVEQVGVADRHADLRSTITEAMEHGTHYPWALLARVQVRKFYSDIFESILGAVWVDSGDMAVCAGVVRRFGILPYLERILRDQVHVLHPKEELGHLADKESVRYDVEAKELEGGEREFSCKVMVGERCVVVVEDGVGREEVKTRAAEAAVQGLKTERESL